MSASVVGVVHSQDILKVFVSLKLKYATVKHTVLEYSKYQNWPKIEFLRT